MKVASAQENSSSRKREPHLTRELGLRAGDALIAVDVQRDFLSGGSLAVPNGDEVLAPLNAYLSAFAAKELPIFLTRDWHPEQHCSFKSESGPWPPHCVQGTPGAEWPQELHLPDEAHIVSKATEKNRDAYSAFEGTALVTLLRKLKVQRLFIGGLAAEFCVRATVLDARKHGFGTVVLDDAIRGIDAAAASRAIEDMVAQGATLFRRHAAPRTLHG